MATLQPVGVEDIPDKADQNQPTPWSLRELGNGHCEIRDANGVEIYHVFCWCSLDWMQLDQKWLSINGVPLSTED
jgi:hypothetical protein